MNPAQIYCTADELVRDMATQEGIRSVGLSDRIKEASKAIQGKFGSFIPIQETRTFTAEYDMDVDKSLPISALLEVQSIKVNGYAITDYCLQPIQRHWLNGPYSMVQRDLGFSKGDEIEITGLWGLYNETEEIDLSVSQATDSEKTVVVTNGGLISLGMVLLIDSEQEYVISGNGSKRSPSPTKATSLLNGAITDIASEQILLVDNGSEFFEGEVLRINSEDILIDRVSGNELTVQRGWNESLIKSHLDDAEIYVYRTFGVVRAVNGTIAAAHTSSAVKRYLVPDDLNWLCRQIAGLMMMKAASGFQGRVGSSETGESMYFTEFPPNQIKTIKENYTF